MRWLTVDGDVGNEQEFYWLWILATTGYGVGDIVTTVALVFYAPAVREGNPLVALALERLGLLGLVGVKLAAFFACLGLSVYAMHAWKDRFVYLMPPVALTAVGVLLTALNISLLVR
ncbi:hypothetical protein [Salarchaeum sp. JOR-1]|uniref:hypothetical protein n=1 Tax=Salarchaeum sp. JOR-1 TaxID=2599399 RepID=UPI0011984C9D|nr:hypothetical protein [Salarchaeum sp. JOR-1]QDX39868.1 hypothetical protein FQU85_02755 [Salarchaeum sp. JOR-1]